MYAPKVLNTANQGALISAARTATTNALNVRMPNNYDGAIVSWDLTAVSGSASLILTIQGQDPVSGAYYDILSSASITTTGTRAYTVCLGVTEANNVSKAYPLPASWRVKVTHATTDSVTYSVGITLVNSSGLLAGTLASGGTVSINNMVTPTVLSVTPTVSTSAYSSGHCVGGKLTLTNAVKSSGGVLRIDSIHVTDKSNQKAAMGIFLFDADPSAATLTDRSALALSTDTTKIVAYLPIAQADFVTVDSKAVANLGGISKRIKVASGTTLYAAIVTTGTPTYAAASDLIIKIGVVQE